MNNCTQGWSFSVILAWDNQKGTFLTHFFNFGHEGAPNVTKITYNMKILWENSPRKKNWSSFVHLGLRYEFLRKKIWTVPLILQFNIKSKQEYCMMKCSPPAPAISALHAKQVGRFRARKQFSQKVPSLPCC